MTVAGSVEYLDGFPHTIQDCADCGCRFTTHDPAVHDQLHTRPAIDYYADYRVLADRSLDWFRSGDAERLRAELSRSTKHRFIIEQVSRQPQSAQLLEIGCARGHLTSYFVLMGRPILGIDVSAEAITAARAAFGDHFAVGLDSAQPPYDLIYHTGLIGCVADPVTLTRRLLAMLKPGGKLFFNAPNRDALRLPGQLWLDSAPPPDLVTLFPAGFWRSRFGDAAIVTEQIEMLDADASMAAAARRLAGIRWMPPSPAPFDSGAHAWPQPAGGPRVMLARAIVKIGRTLRLSTLAAPRPAEFGLLVSISPKIA
ncbi:MAG: class I SAM-dependent methyltransferase [Vicinamibacterales bacterium]